MISNETVENRACLASQLTLNEVETERRRMSDMMSYSSMPPFFRQKSTQDLLEKVLFFCAYFPMFLHLRITMLLCR